ncbi:Pentatricopeptide repeat-containing protein At3g49170, chloroplastic [Linum perenne]
MISLSASSPANLLSPSSATISGQKLPNPSLSFKPNANFEPLHLKDRLIRHLDAGQLPKAVSILNTMGRNGTFPDQVTYSLLLRSCIRSQSFQLGRIVHDSLVQSGMEPDSVLLNSLISLYSKCGDWERAEAIFGDMDGEKRDVVSWSAMISCYANKGMEFEAIGVFVDMLESGVYPNEYCYTAVIRACSKEETVEIGEAVFGSVLKTGHLGADVCVGCGLIDMFVKGSKNLDDAYKVFDKMPDRNDVSWTLMITRFHQLGRGRDAIGVFVDMVSSGCVPDRFTHCGVISACAELGSLSAGRQLHTWVIKSGMTWDVCIGCSLVDMYIKCNEEGSLVESRKVFVRMQDHNVMSWTAIITGYVQNGRHDLEAIKFFVKMMQGGQVKPNEFTLAAVLKACAGLSNSRIGEQVYGYAVKVGLASVNCVGNSVISMYAKCGHMENARKAFDVLFDKNLVSYNTMVNAYAKSSNSEEAFELVQKIEDAGVEIDTFTYASLLSGASSIGAISKGEQIHARILKSSFKPSLHVSNALISMYSTCGNIEASYQVFKDMEKERNVISWTSMVTGFAKHGLATRALETFYDMLEAGVKPNDVTYIAVLSACSHAGLVSEGWEHFESMKSKHRIIPRMEHYACMVDLLGRSGRLTEALDFINSMPFKPDPLVLRTFLGACQVHGNTNLGRLAADMILDQDPDDPAAYVLLSNLYASSGQWEEVAEIRKQMKQRNLAKEAGCSWIETDNVVHKFHVGDTTHRRAFDIFEELKQLGEEIKELGYVPQTEFVLHDVGEEQKEMYLLQHSERIAVAFGFISSSGSSKPVRVFKNLRICGDCHTAFKYFSMVRDREIMVRDSNRFHHFKNGTCSCNDYW